MAFQTLSIADAELIDRGQLLLIDWNTVKVATLQLSKEKYDIVTF